jgi:hypothetical protein
LKEFDLLDYRAEVFYKSEQHYPFTVSLLDKVTEKEAHLGNYVTIDQLCFMTHQEMLLHDFHSLNPMQTLHAVERMRDELDLWMDILGE